MGGFGSGRQGSLPKIESGLKLDLRSLRQQGILRPDTHCSWTKLHWRESYSGEEVATIGFSYCTSGDRPWLRLNYTAKPWDGEPVKVEETFELVRFPQPFGGYRVYAVCPRTRNLCQCLYLPPGATRFRCRRGFNVRLQYRSQSLTPPERLIETRNKIADKVRRKGPPEWRKKFECLDFPPKPPWMRWRTYERQLARWERFEELCEAYLATCIARLGGVL